MPHDWKAAWSSIKLGLNLTGFTFVNYFHRQFDNVLIGWRWGSVELGYYARAYALLQAPVNFANGPIGNVLEPALARIQDKPDQWRRAYLDGLAVVVLLNGAMACTLFGGAKPIIQTVYGPQWTETISIFGMLALSMLFATPMSTTGWIYVSLGRTGRMLRWALIAVPFYVGSFVIGLPYGALGVATGYSIAATLLCLPCLMMAVRETPVTLGDTLNIIWPASLCSAVVGLALHWLTPQTGTLMGLLLTGLGLLAYLAAIALLIFRWPPYASLKGHTARTFGSILQRLEKAYRARNA